MQRRAAALYAVFFLVVGVLSFSLISTATAPQLSFENPEHELGEGDDLVVDGTTYTLDSITAEMKAEGGGGHGGGGGKHLVRSGTIVWTNESARVTAEWGADSSITYQNESWTVVVDGGENATEVTLRESINRTAILQNDSDVQNSVQTVDGTEYVVREDGDNRTLIPADDYFPDPETLTFEEGESVQFEGEAFTISTVNGDGATLSRVSPQEVEISVSNKANVTVGSEQYFAYFPNNDTLVLTKQYETYQQHKEETKQFAEHESGLWGVSIVTMTGAVFLIALAYLPNRY